MVYFIYFTTYWILNISYAKSKSNKAKLSKYTFKNGVLSLKNYLKALGFKVWPHNLTV